MAITMRKRAVRRDWTSDEVKELKKHSKDKTRVKTILENTQTHPGCRKTKSSRARNPGRPLPSQDVGVVI
jgi:hypothetical protein